MSTTEIIARPPVDGNVDTTDIVYAFSTVTWQAASRRGWFASEDRLVRSLLDSERVGRLLICNHARSRPRKLVRALLGTDRVPFPADERTALIEPVRWRGSEPRSIPAVERECAAFDLEVGRAAHRMGMRDPVVISGHPLVAGFAELAWARAVTWYATDDWAEHPGYARWRDAYREAYARVRTRGRRVAAVSSVLLDRLAPTGPSTVIPNGLDPGEWTGEVAPPDWLDGLPGPLLVYAGTLDDRIDVPWLLDLGHDLPAATILLVGPVVDEAHLAPLRALPNLQLCAPVGRAALTGLMRAADVGLLPHRTTRLTEAMSPLKLFEYLAAGLPVAASDLPPVRRVAHPRVCLVPAGGPFTPAVTAALALGRAAESERLAFVRDNSWRRRHNDLLDLALA